MIVFYPLDAAFTHEFDWSIFVLVVVLSGFCLWLGMILEGREDFAVGRILQREENKRRARKKAQQQRAAEEERRLEIARQFEQRKEQQADVGIFAAIRGEGQRETTFKRYH